MTLTEGTPLTQINIANLPSTLVTWRVREMKTNSLEWKIITRSEGRVRNRVSVREETGGETLQAGKKNYVMQLEEYIPNGDISGTPAKYGPSLNFGSLSLMSWTLTTNSDLGSTGILVSLSTAWACRV